MQIFSESLQHLKCLKKLYLNSNTLNDISIIYLAENFIHLSVLEVLNLSENKVHDESAVVMADNFKYLNKLVELKLDDNIIGIEGMKAIYKNLDCLKSIMTLSISNNQNTQEILDMTSNINETLNYFRVNKKKVKLVEVLMPEEDSCCFIKVICKINNEDIDSNILRSLEVDDSETANLSTSKIVRIIDDNDFITVKSKSLIV